MRVTRYTDARFRPRPPASFGPTSGAEMLRKPSPEEIDRASATR